MSTWLYYTGKSPPEEGGAKFVPTSSQLFFSPPIVLASKTYFWEHTPRSRVIFQMSHLLDFFISFQLAFPYLVTIMLRYEKNNEIYEKTWVNKLDMV
jgi:hypothetical protein